MYQTHCFNVAQTDPEVESLGVQRQQMQRKPGYANLENIQNIEYLVNDLGAFSISNTLKQSLMCKLLKLCHLITEQTHLIADEVKVRHGRGLVPLTAVQSRGQRELAVRPSWLQTSTSG